MRKLIKVQNEDNVAVALVDLKQGEKLHFEGDELVILVNTKAKHKISLVELQPNDNIYMYGVLVGRAVTHIDKGGLLTVGNVKHQTNPVKEKTTSVSWTAPSIEKWKDRTFMGYHRPDGQVGTENVWLFFPLVFCENRNIEVLKDIFEKELSISKVSKQQQLLRDLISGNTADVPVYGGGQKAINLENIKIKFITHQGGCGGIRQDSETLAKLLAGYVKNPNVAGATVLSLGCQNLQVDIFKKALSSIDPDLEKPVLIYEQQQMGTVDHVEYDYKGVFRGHKNGKWNRTKTCSPF